MAASWTPCTCGEFFCNIHQQHASECDCPPIDEWDTDPYSEMPKMNSTKRVKKTRSEAAKQGRKRKEYLVSDDEHIKIKALLSELRG